MGSDGEAVCAPRAPCACRSVMAQGL
jgi:hypothetical protein